MVKSDCVHFRLQTCMVLLGQRFFSLWGTVSTVVAKAISDALFEKVDELRPSSA